MKLEVTLADPGNFRLIQTSQEQLFVDSLIEATANVISRVDHQDLS